VALSNCGLHPNCCTGGSPSGGRLAPWSGAKPRPVSQWARQRRPERGGEHKTSQYFGYLAFDGSLSFWLERAHYRRQRRHDGIFILQTNHNQLSAAEIVRSYMQLQEVERAFRVLKSLLKVRPMFHWAERRVETHIFICFLAYLLAKVLELRLKSQPATEHLSIAKALDRLATLKAVDYRSGDFLITELSEPQDPLKPVLAALELKLPNPVLRTAPAPAA